MDEASGSHQVGLQNTSIPQDRAPLLRLAVLSFFSAVLLLQITATIWSLLALGHYPCARSGLPPYDGTWADAASVSANGGLQVTVLDTTGPAAGIGIREGDLIVAVNGIGLREHPEIYFRTLLNSSQGDTLRVEWVRDGTRYLGSLVLEELPPSMPGIQRTGGIPSLRRDIAWWIQATPFLIYDIVALLVGAFVGFLRMRDLVAFRLGVALLTGGTCMILTLLPLSSLWPVWVSGPVFFCSTSSTALWGPMLIGFLAVFPVRTRLGDLLLKFWWVFWIVFGAWALGDTLLYLRLLNPSLRPLAEALEFLQTHDNTWSIALTVPLVAALLLAQRRATRQWHIRRMKVLEASFLLFLVGGMFLLVARLVNWPYVSLTWMWFGRLILPYGFLAAFVVVLGYAVVADRFFGIHFAIRRGLQYLLLSRGMLLGEFVLLFFIAVQVLRNARFEFSESMPVVSALAMMSSILVVAGLRRANRPLMAVIDLRFFREAYDARRVLVGLGEEVATLAEPKAIIERAGEAVLAALHPARVGFFTLRGGDGWQPTLAWGRWQTRVGARGGTPTTVADESESAPEDLAVVEDALSQIGTGRQWADYPPTRVEADAPPDFSLPARYELVLPLRAGSELLGCLALAVKLSEQPYSREDKELLQGVTQAVGMALKNAMLVEVAKREARQARDLEIARGVQQGLFPQVLPSVPGWEFAAACFPAQVVAGDYYDLFEVETGKVAFAIGDVSGKGLGASLLMANLHALMRSLLPRAAGDLAAFTTEVNEHLVASSPSGMFVTLFVGVLDVATGELRYVNAGHPPALAFCWVGDDVQRLETGGLVVGVLPGIRYEVGVLGLATGSVLAIYSDGVTEATSTVGEMYEEERLVEVLAACGGKSAAEVFSAVMESVECFSRGAEQADDITLVVIQRAGVVSNASPAHAQPAVETTE